MDSAVAPVGSGRNKALVDPQVEANDTSGDPNRVEGTDAVQIRQIRQSSFGCSNGPRIHAHETFNDSVEARFLARNS